MLSLNSEQRTYIRALLDALSIRGPDARADLFINEMIESGETWAAPTDQPEDWQDLLIEMPLHGIRGVGRNTEQAIANWMKVADRILTGDFPFAQPKNHAEEIANAVALEGMV